jgi:hypothetical protein
MPTEIAGGFLSVAGQAAAIARCEEQNVRSHVTLRHGLADGS